MNISNLQIISSSFDSAGIKFNSNSLKIVISNFNYTLNSVDKTTNCFDFSAFDSVTIQDSIFKSNSGVQADDLYISSVKSGNVIFQNWSFNGAGSTNLGVYNRLPGLFIDSSSSISFINWKFQDYVKISKFGAVRIKSSNITFNSWVFQSNDGEEGGSLYVTLNSVVSLNNWTLNNNHAKVKGGWIEANENSIVSSTNWQFSNNTAINSAVIYLVSKGAFIDCKSN